MPKVISIIATGVSIINIGIGILVKNPSFR